MLRAGNPVLGNGMAGTWGAARHLAAELRLDLSAPVRERLLEDGLHMRGHVRVGHLAERLLALAHVLVDRLLLQRLTLDVLAPGYPRGLHRVGYRVLFVLQRDLVQRQRARG